MIVLLALLIIPSIIYYRMPNHCREPITYRIGKVDERFALDPQEFRTIVQAAADLWAKPISRHLFREDPAEGLIEINLVYDYRQEATDRLKKINYKIDYSKNSYGELRTRIENLKGEFEQKNKTLGEDLNVYQERVNTFNTETDLWNRQGGASESIQQRLIKERDDLINLRDNLNARREELKELTDTINSLVVVINEIASRHNLDLMDHQNAGNTLGREFCEGLYEKKKGRQTITIYQFEDRDRLVRVLAHEFGHALGLSHGRNEEAIMYRLNNSLSLELDPEDVAGLKKRCKMQ
ncbi:MAG: matrixin family metalloprotease [Deltaproteobacteria bacterium]|nr:matrixin family metalloprotease [Deltaproteobacteria bacterium]